MTLSKPKFIAETLHATANAVVLASLLAHLFNPFLAQAQTAEPTSTEQAAESAISAEETTLSESPEGRLLNPKVEIIHPNKTIRAVITAYTSTRDQTDDDPFVAASGRRVYDGMIAANGLPFGTQIKIPSLYGDKIFTVHDRMNRRYGYGRMDIWLDTTKAEARKFGVKRVDVEIYFQPSKLAQVK